METSRQVIANGKWRLFILFIISGQILIEFNCNDLFLWPIEHSCARPANMSIYSTLFIDSRRQQIDLDAIQTNLFDATPEDSFTVARASSMGINYDDIAHCYEYPVIYDNKTNQATINMIGLETCKNGIHYEQFKPQISIIGQFELSCKRQWLKVALPQMIGLGLLVGFLYYKLNVKKSNKPNGGHSKRCSLLNIQAAIGLMALVMGDIYLLKSQPTKRLHNFPILMAIIFVRSTILGSILAKVSDAWGTDKIKPISITNQLSDDLICFITFVSTSIVLKALFLPVALRLFSDWQTLNQVLTLDVLVILIIVTLYEQFVRMNSTPNELNNQLSSDVAFAANTTQKRMILMSTWRQVLLNETRTREANDDDDDDFELKQELNQNDSSNQHGLNTTNPSRVCEFCLMRDQSIFAMSMHRRPGTMGGQHVQNFGLEIVDTYSPTTIPISSYVANSDDHQLSENKSNVIVNETKITRLSHNPGGYANLMDASSVRKLSLLTFCLAFNYMAFKMMPNHRLLHSESMESLLNRKLEYRLVTDKEEPAMNIIREEMEFTSNLTTHLDNHVYVLNVTHHQVGQSDLGLNNNNNTTTKNSSSTSDIDTNINLHPFNYNRVDYGTKTLNILRDSQNIFKILWATMSLNDWIIDLIVLLIHTTNCTSFRLIYFKLNRLFALVSFGSVFLLVEWLLVALVRRQHHLFGWYWLKTIVYLTAKSVATLMYINFMHTILKLSKLLQTNQLSKSLNWVQCLMIALIVASMAPMAERWSLLIIPLVLVLNNLLIYYLTKQISKQFKENLCPMMFDDGQ